MKEHKTILKEYSLADIANTKSIIFDSQLSTFFCQAPWWVCDILNCEHPRSRVKFLKKIENNK